MPDTKLIYLMDPHCGWCFGYSETISTIRDHALTSGSTDLEVIPGGLFTPKIRGSAEFADGKRQIASRIEDLFGVTFSPNYFENVLAAPWVDSTPSNQALHACNLLEPSRTLDLSRAIINAAFIDGRNISHPEVVLEIAQEQEFDRQVLGEVMASHQVEQALTSAQRFTAEARTGFPSVFSRDTETGRLVHLGGADLTIDALAPSMTPSSASQTNQ